MSQSQNSFKKNPYILKLKKGLGRWQMSADTRCFVFQINFRKPGSWQPCHVVQAATDVTEGGGTGYVILDLNKKLSITDKIDDFAHKRNCFVIQMCLNAALLDHVTLPQPVVTLILRQKWLASTRLHAVPSIKVHVFAQVPWIQLPQKHDGEFIIW